MGTHGPCHKFQIEKTSRVASEPSSPTLDGLIANDVLPMDGSKEMSRTTLFDAQSSEKFQCPLCSNRYSRHEHLQRHLASHIPNRPFECSFCARTFKRRDVLRRHYGTCKSRIGSGLDVNELPDFAPTTKRRACDRCVRQKRACTSTQSRPCEACLSRNQQCTFSTAPSSHDDPIRQSDSATGQMASEELSSSEMVSAAETNTMVTISSQPFQQTSTSFASDPWSFLNDSSQLTFDFSSDMDWQDLQMPRSVHLDRPAIKIEQLTPNPDQDQDPVEDFVFMAQITSTTGFLVPFDCGSLSQRQEVLKLAIGDASFGSFRVSEFTDCRVTHQEAQYMQGLPSAYSANVSDWSTDGVNTGGWDSEEAVPPPDLQTPLTNEWRFAQTFTDRCVPGENEYTGSMNQHLNTPLNSSSQILSQWISEPLAFQTHAIVRRIREVSCFGHRNSAVATGWSHILEQMCLQFFSPPNLTKFLTLYWATWHPNWPVIHKPTFDAKSASPLLLASMVLIAACMSPEPSDKANAELWFNAVEEMTFGDDCFGDGSVTIAHQNVTFKKRQLQTIQAAYAVCLYQNWEGTDSGRRRVRRYRYSTVVAAARDLDIINAKHLDLESVSAGDFDWADFIIREEMIRTLIYIFLLDTAFVIFNNLPPRMVIRELQMDLACPEPCFQASNPETCYTEIQSWIRTLAWRRRMSLGVAIETICQKDLDPGVLQVFSELGILNLFTITSAFHSLIFHLQTSFGGYEPQLGPVRTALGNWKTAWMARKAAEVSTSAFSTQPQGFNAENMWQRIGFMRNAPEYWLLARIVLDRLEASQNADKITDNLTSNQSRRGSIGNNLPSKYDETSMSQVNELIAEFKSVNLKAGQG